MKKVFALIFICVHGFCLAQLIPAEVKALLRVDVAALRATPFGKALETQLQADPEFDAAAWEGVKALTLFATPQWYAVYLEGGHAAALKPLWMPEEEGDVIVMATNALLVVESARSDVKLKTALDAVFADGPKIEAPALKPGEIAAGKMTETVLFFPEKSKKKSKKLKSVITAALTAKPIEQAGNVRETTLSLIPAEADALMMLCQIQALDAEKAVDVRDSLLALKALLGILLSQEPALANYLTRHATIRQKEESITLTLMLSPRLIALLAKNGALSGE